jgi:hypothetical protein
MVDVELKLWCTPCRQSSTYVVLDDGEIFNNFTLESCKIFHIPLVFTVINTI